ncbi:MAG: hypothetical protein NW216_15490 [Hyphomicrobium sp.]|nr:hypothetical protein [Hyphomicrobium sp.]
MRTTEAAKVALAAALTLGLGACASDQLDTSTGTVTQKVAETPGFVPGVPQGFQCPLVPNGMDPPGSIYRLDSKGTYWRVKDYSTDPAIAAIPNFRRQVKVANYALSDRQLASAGLSYEVLKSALPGLSAEGGADFKKQLAVNVIVEDMEAELIDDVVAEKILERFKAEVTPQPGSRYFLVREAVKAGAVSYSLKRADVAKLGGEAQIENLAKAKTNVTVRDNDGAFEIKQVFAPDRLSVCIKPAELVVEPKRSQGAAVVTLKSPEETAAPEIKKVGSGT